MSPMIYKSPLTKCKTLFKIKSVCSVLFWAGCLHVHSCTVHDVISVKATVVPLAQPLANSSVQLCTDLLRRTVQ